MWPASTIVIDLRSCSYLDSVCLHVLFEAAAQADNVGRRFTIVGATGIVRRLFDVADVERFIDVTD